MVNDNTGIIFSSSYAFNYFTPFVLTHFQSDAYKNYSLTLELPWGSKWQVLKFHDKIPTSS